MIQLQILKDICLLQRVFPITTSSKVSAKELIKQRRLNKLNHHILICITH